MEKKAYVKASAVFFTDTIFHVVACVVLLLWWCGGVVLSWYGVDWIECEIQK